VRPAATEKQTNNNQSIGVRAGISLQPGRVKEKRIGPWPDCGGASADFLETCSPVRHFDWRQHVAFALGRDRQRPPGVQKIENAIFQRTPFILVKLGMAEVRLLEKRQIGRHSTSGLWKTLPACVLPLAIVIEPGEISLGAAPG
jgi:hypothetical protein